ncbi:MAG: hypothetical protein B1H05_04145 [Candidatus Cloacimonas sp. 4484_140]|nr:MAG: hypothetical protein B1H05_04145 [Candidatus Cloacimonas sp. 4484_140]
MKLLSWIFAILGLLFMLAGCINYLAGDWLFHVSHTISYFQVAISLLLVSIFFTLIGKKE